MMNHTRRLAIGVSASLAAVACLAYPARILAQSARNGGLNEAQALYQQGASDYAEANYAKAADEFRRALELDPSSAELLTDLGVAYYMAHDFRESVETLKRAIVENPNSVSANLILGLSLVRLNQPAESVGLLKRAVALQPTNQDALLGLASAYFALARMDEAAHAYLELTALGSRDANVWYGLGICFERLSEDDTRWLAQHAPNSPYYHLLLSEFFLRQGSGFDAEQELREAAASGEAAAAREISVQLGYALLEQQQILPAQKAFDRALAADRANVDAMLGQASANAALGRFAEARSWLCFAFAGSPEAFSSHVAEFASTLSLEAAQSVIARWTPRGSHAPCRRAVRQVLENLARPGSVDDAPHAFSTLTKQLRRVDNASAAMSPATLKGACAEALAAPTSSSPAQRLLVVRCEYELGWFYASFEASRQAGQDDAGSIEAVYWQAEAAKRLAREAFLHLVSVNPSAWQSRVLLGDIERERKQWKAANADYQAAARVKPSSPAPFLGMATVAWQTGALANAAAALQKALKLDAQNVQANFEMGDILVRQHKYGMAIPYLQRALAREPELLTGHGDLGKCYAELGNVDAAIREISLALPTDRAGDLHYLLSLQYKKLGELGRARRALAESQKLRDEETRNQQQRLTEALRAAQSRNRP